jgi:excisionase family DNA binding protein
VAIRDLATHVDPYVSVNELADYWHVSRKYIYNQINTGALPALRLGVRLVRIQTKAAQDFEQRAAFNGSANKTG